jgi:hypothetical protein
LNAVEIVVWEGEERRRGEDTFMPFTAHGKLNLPRKEETKYQQLNIKQRYSILQISDFVGMCEERRGEERERMSSCHLPHTVNSPPEPISAVAAPAVPQPDQALLFYLLLFLLHFLEFVWCAVLFLGVFFLMWCRQLFENG